MRFRIIGSLGLMLAAWAWVAAAETVRLPCTRDTWIMNVGAEADQNAGRAARIKLKFVEEFGLLDFEVSALKGQAVGAAWLYLHPSGGAKWGLNHGSDLNWLTVSTVAHPWEEGSCVEPGRDEDGHGATYNESATGRDNWGWPGATLADVSLGNHHSLRDDTRLEFVRDGWFRARIDARLVQALVSGAAHGLTILDGTGDYMLNESISSRESGKGPYLLVTTTGADTNAPVAVSNLTVRPASVGATTSRGAAEVAFTVPESAFSYDITLNDEPLARWQIPFPAQAGRLQRFVIENVPAGEDVTLSIQAVDAAGNASPRIAALGRTSSVFFVPPVPASIFTPQPGEPRALGAAARVWAAPELTEIDPVSGRVLFEKDGAALRTANPVWDGATGTIRLAAARGEIVSFQLVVEGAVTGLTVAVSELASPVVDASRHYGASPSVDASRHYGARPVPVSSRVVRLWRNWYVNGQPEYAVPLTGPLSVPAPDNAVKGQSNQTVTVDVALPTDTAPGTYTGAVTLTTEEAALDLPLQVMVYDVTIPAAVFFNPELNCYSGPYEAGSEGFKASHRLAHYHRCAINRVPYSQSGNTHADLAPVTDATGQVTDWTAYDRNVGGLLDGSWFADNPRAGVPVATFYLPLYEGWPLDYRKFYQPGCPVPDAGGREEMAKHHVLAKPLEQALPPAYQQAVVKCAADFRQHAQERGWTRTLLQMYLNNKGWKSASVYSMWTLDEPYKYADWHALNFWGRLFNRGVDDPDFFTRAWHDRYFREGGVAAMKRDRPTLVYRGDVSRAVWQGDVSDGIMGIMYGNLPRGWRERAPMIAYTYGACPHNNADNWASAAWCLKAYAMGQDGVLPWQSIGEAGALQRGDDSLGGDGGNALIVTGSPFGPAVASLRVHALRRGAQDSELLRLLQLRKGWSREQVQAFAQQRVPVGGGHEVTDAAAAMKFNALSAANFLALKEGILQMLAPVPPASAEAGVR